MRDTDLLMTNSLHIPFHQDSTARCPSSRVGQYPVQRGGITSVPARESFTRTEDCILHNATKYFVVPTIIARPLKPYVSFDARFFLLLFLFIYLLRKIRRSAVDTVLRLNISSLNNRRAHLRKASNKSSNILRGINNQ